MNDINKNVHISKNLEDLTVALVSGGISIKSQTGQSATGRNRFVSEITWHSTPTWPAGGTAAPR